MAKTSVETDLESVPNVNLLAIDSNAEVLEFIKKTCNQYSHQVTTHSESLLAVDVLRESKNDINLILIEVHMPLMNGYEFLQFVNEKEIDVPVIVMSADDNKSSIVKAFSLGACDYWSKPLHEDQFKNMWKHIVRKSMRENKTQNDIGNLENDKKRGTSDNSEFASSSMVLERSNSSSQLLTNDDDSKINNLFSTRKPRVVWTTNLHNIFEKAINKIGLANAVPKKILEAMNHPGLERGHVASHLQKYRKLLKADSDREPKKPRQNEQQNEASFVSRNTEPRIGECGRIPLQPLPTTTLPAVHPGLTSKMVPKREEQYDPNTQLANVHPGVTCKLVPKREEQYDPNMQLANVHRGLPSKLVSKREEQYDPNMQYLVNVHRGLPSKLVPKREEQYDPNMQLATQVEAQQALAYHNSWKTFSNICISDNFSQSLETLDKASRLCFPSDTVLVNNQAINQRDNMQQSMMYHRPIRPINSHSSSVMISDNPATQNYSFGMNNDHGLRLPQSSRNSFGVQTQGGINTDEIMLNQYNTRASVHPQLQYPSLPSGAVFDTQVPYDSASDFSKP